MNLRRLTINKPFEADIESESVKKGDVALYDKEVMLAIRSGQMLEVTTPEGVTYADPRTVRRGRSIFRKFKLPKPMLLYVLTPEYGNHDKFMSEHGVLTPEEEQERRRKLLAVMRAGLKK